MMAKGTAPVREDHCVTTEDSTVILSGRRRLRRPRRSVKTRPRRRWNMKRWQVWMAGICLVASLVLGCATFPGNSAARPWIILADEHRDIRCRIVSAQEATAILRRGGYRILKNYVTGYAYVYSTEPLTDLRRCREAVR